MVDTTKLEEEAVGFLAVGLPDKALAVLAPQIEQNTENIPFLEVLGETLLENDQVENAYQVFVRACQLDPEVNFGADKYFYAGQIIGGTEGIVYIDQGLAKLQLRLQRIIDNHLVELDPGLAKLAKLYGTSEELTKYLVKTINKGIFSEIEIWMTDLCMEEEAETQCDHLINQSLQIDQENPEALSMLASIKVSQQRPDEAQQAIVKSWELFDARKCILEEEANRENSEAVEVQQEYLELYEPLLTVAKLSIELELYETAILAASGAQDINELSVEAYYYEGLAALLHGRQLHATSHGLDNYRELEIASSDNEEAQQFLDDARIALTHGYKALQVDEEVDPEVVEQVNVLLSPLGGPLMSELMRGRNEEEPEGWEEEIEE